MSDIKKCRCGNLFRPFAPHQTRCMRCITLTHPKKPTDGMPDMTSEFVEWFIYTWHTMRKDAGIKVDDGIVKTYSERKVTTKKSLPQMCRERGVEVSTVRKRMQRGWTLSEALEGKRK